MKLMERTNELKEIYNGNLQMQWHLDMEIESAAKRHGYEFLYYTECFDQFTNEDLLIRFARLYTLDQYQRLVAGFFSYLLEFDVTDPSVESIIIWFAQELGRKSDQELIDLTEDFYPLFKEVYSH